MLTTTSAKLTGTPGASGWAQVHEFVPEDPLKLQARGHLFAVVATKRVETSGNIDTIASGRELIARLHEEYFGQTEGKAFNVLKNAVEKVMTEFKEAWGDVEIVACALTDGIIYSAAGGGAELTIFRNGMLGTILKSEEGNVIAASGYPKAGDLMLLATKSFGKSVPSGVARAALSMGSPEEAVEALAPSVHGDGELGDLGAIVIKFDEEAAFTIKTEKKVPMAVKTLSKNLKESLEGFLGRFIKKFPERKIYVKTPTDDRVSIQSKKLTFSVAIILLVLLTVSIGFGVRQKRINDAKRNYDGILTSAQGEVEEAINLASVSKDRSRELFFASEEKLKQIEAMKVKDARVSELRSKIDESRAAVLGEYMGSPGLFLDLTLLSSGFKGDNLSSSGGKIFVLDKNGKKVISVDIATKKSKVVAGPDTIEEADDLASYEDRIFILASDGVYELDNGKTKVIDKSWDGKAMIRAFAANLYVLDITGNAIYRYAGSGNSFGDKQNWLAGGTRADFSPARQWVIDGSIYILTGNTKVLKYSQGSPQNFFLTGVVPEIGTIDAIYADPDNRGVYLLDKAGKRVVVTGKKGEYIAQYIDPEIGSASNLVVSESEKKIILLTGDKLEVVELKHI